MNHLIAQKKIKSCMCLPRAKPLLSQTSQPWQMSRALLWCGSLATTIELLVCLSLVLRSRLSDSKVRIWYCHLRMSITGSCFPWSCGGGIWLRRRVTICWGLWPVRAPVSGASNHQVRNSCVQSCVRPAGDGQRLAHLRLPCPFRFCSTQPSVTTKAREGRVFWRPCRGEVGMTRRQDPGDPQATVGGARPTFLLSVAASWFGGLCLEDR